MGQYFSSQYRRYDPYTESVSLPNRIPLSLTMRNESTRKRGAPFYFDHSDPASLVRELQKYRMAGIVIWPDCNCEDGSGTLYLIGEDEMPSSIIDIRQGPAYSAVYPEHCGRRAHLSVRGEALRRAVQDHKSFHTT
ncbi:hypothetical protein TWF694_007723 [Orbilia ellipsospora]|uniref:Uncharacterized protein n=1 Tax=Orbilia ellipsospora TaxID=2528407 RepID=A0AAV9XJ13_9PEZI